ncbi:hypothetical protein FRC07_009949, partial [Ceratobasidium sp. 392]
MTSSALSSTRDPPCISAPIAAVTLEPFQAPGGSQLAHLGPVDKHKSWGRFRKAVNTMSKVTDVFGPINDAVAPLVSLMDEFLTITETQEGYQDLRAQWAPLLDVLEKHDSAATPPSIAKSIAELGSKIKEEIDNAEQNRHTGSMSRLWNKEQDAEMVRKCYEIIQTHIQGFTVNAKIDEWKITIERETETRLKGLPNSLDAQYRSAKALELGRGGCTEYTRAEVLEQMRAWAHDAESERIYWLNGMAGTGKTTIAYSLCERLEKGNKLAASFFCSRQLPECRDVMRIVPSIVYQLSRLFPPFRRAISTVLESNPDFHNQPILEQFDQLLIQPMSQVKDRLPSGLVVVVDALDECDHEESVAKILDVLFSRASDLPIRFFVTSRPEQTILNRMRNQQSEGVNLEMRLHELAHRTVQKDIRTYLRAEFAPTNLSVSDAAYDILVERSGVLFIYAATVVRYVLTKNSAKRETRLAELLDMSTSWANESTKRLDDLYTAILDAAYDDEEMTDRDRGEMLLVLHTVACALEPLSQIVMAGLLQLEYGERSVRAALLPLSSVLQVSDATGTITTLHESFRDYLLDRSRSGARFYCDAKEHNSKLFRLCFDQISIPKRPFNILGLESSFVLDTDIPDLTARVNKVVSGELLYACRYWGAHLRMADYGHELAGMLLDFLSKRLLLWMEVMNLAECFTDGTRAMYELEKWTRSVEGLDEETRLLLRDACAFMSAYASSPARHSTPHLYVSALPFWPANSPVARLYQKGTTRIVNQRSTAMKARRVVPLTISEAQSPVLCVAYSPNGLHLVSGSYDETVRIWDARTGEQLRQPLQGHTGRVLSVAYSPDGAYIVSGSSDNTVCIWDARTGEQVRHPLQGHTNSVRSVAYSPDGAYIVSGSSDNTVCIWDARTGEQARQPLQ